MADQTKVLDMIKGVRFAALTTATPDGLLVSRPMTVQEVGDDLTCLFICQRADDVAQQSDGKPVNLMFVDGADFVSVAGTGELRDDVAKKTELWDAANDAYAEGGPENPDNVILAVVPESASYWDSPGAVAMVLGIAQAKLTGDKPKVGEHGTVEL